MRLRRFGAWGLAILVAVGLFSPVGAQRPDPHSWEPGAATATAEATDSGCDLVEAYSRGVDTALRDASVFSDFLVNTSADFGDYTVDEAEDVIQDGNILIESLGGLQVPPPYLDAHEAFIGIVQFKTNEIRFLTLDTSIVPDIASYELAFDTIIDGELEMAGVCPDAIDEIGGYIILNPASQEAPVNPDDLPD